MRVLLMMLAALAWVVAATAPASASDVIFYSKPDNTYGWCAGYSYSRGEACAREQCSSSGGKDCQLAVECDAGWGAVAFAGDPYSGIGAGCMWKDANTARFEALVACIAANKALCWTSSTFDGNGRQRSDADNQNYDLTWYAQTFLNAAKYDAGDADGAMGSRTRAAVRKFQTDLGRDPTGKIDLELLDRMIDAARGTDGLINAVLDALKDGTNSLGEYRYGYADTDNPVRTYQARLLDYTDDKRRAALATVLKLEGTDCTIPAQAVELLDKEGTVWNIDCAEGPYSLLIAYGSTIISSGHATYTDKGKEDATPNGDGRQTHTRVPAAAHTN